jgi:hypothetical protein
VKLEHAQKIHVGDHVGVDDEETGLEVGLATPHGARSSERSILDEGAYVEAESASVTDGIPYFGRAMPKAKEHIGHAFASEPTENMVDHRQPAERNERFRGRARGPAQAAPLSAG